MVRERQWRTTSLYAALEARRPDGAHCIRLLEACMDDIEDLLHSGGGGASEDFTLHDDGHAFRVAQRMSDILGEQLARISVYDLTMLLLSAYLHDIGMTPARPRVDAHFAYLRRGDRSRLDDNEVRSLQKWLDDFHGGLVPPVIGDAANPEGERFLRLLMAHYARSRHNDWSEAWIRERLADERDPYYGWLEDLVRLCRSHHEGYERLRGDDFDPQLIGSPAGYLHLRHCACILRVADVLEFDPERTPDVVFEHRGIDESSAIYWRKDHALAFELVNGAVVINARPPNAYIHRAVLETIDGVNHELDLCRRLAEEKPFEVPPTRGNPLPNEWPLEPRVSASITPLADSYEYVDGTFRPDVERVLALLGGVELYGTPWAAARELVQNAFDAVRERIARQRLQLQDPFDSRWLAANAEDHQVVVRLETDGDNCWLVCTDSGIGMSKDRIVNQFLVSGHTKRHVDYELERACEARGFVVGRTARFGIGVLSYFLLASELELATRVAPEGLPTEQTALHFETRGVGSFGELRRIHRDAPGTEVRLRLLPSLAAGSAAEVARELETYLRSVIRRVPCRFVVEGCGMDFRVGPGWVAPRLVDPAASRRGGAASRSTPAGPVTAMDPEDLTGALTVTPELTAEPEWLEAEGEVRDLGCFRAAVPCFDIGGGRCLLAPVDSPTHDDAGTSDLVFLLPATIRTMSWNGMWVEERHNTPESEHGRRDEAAIAGHTQPTAAETWAAVQQTEHGVAGLSFGPSMLLARSSPKDNRFGVLDVDWTSDGSGTLAVHRTSLTLSGRARAALEDVDKATTALAREFALNEPGEYALLNRLVANVELDGKTPVHWSCAVRGRAEWQEVSFPAVLDTGWGVVGTEEAIWHEHPVTRLRPIRTAENRTYVWPFAPTKVVESAGPSGRSFRLLWDNAEALVLPEVVPPPTAEFPPAWSNVVATVVEGPILNSTHPLVQLVDDRAWTSVSELVASSPGAIGQLQSPAESAAFLLQVLLLAHDKVPRWNSICRAKPEFAARLWSAVCHADAELLVLRTGRSRPVARYHDSGEEDMTLEVVPPAGDDWTMRLTR